jgi:murein DD-endopeptidase MepM/ murein hydrolase activator NlpD
MTIVCLATFLCVLAPLDAGKPPAGQTYFTILLGLDSPYSWDADCLKFTATRLLTSDGAYGSWTRTEPVGPQTAFAFEMEFEEQGETVQMDGQGRVDDRGKKNTIAGVARIRSEGGVGNFGFTGRSTTRKKCNNLLRQWVSGSPPEGQAAQNAACVERASFGDPAQSVYILPFPVGKSYNLSQTYCYLHSSHKNEYAYDFDMPLGAEIIASRAGEVVEVIENLPSDQPWPDNNRLQIQHQDGTVARYLHVKQNSVIPVVGDTVEMGQVIAQAAMSGTIDPHLHFAVYRSFPGIEADDVSVNFRNADGPHDARGGLIQGGMFTALPW